MNYKLIVWLSLLQSAKIFHLVWFTVKYVLKAHNHVSLHQRLLAWHADYNIKAKAITAEIIY